MHNVTFTPDQNMALLEWLEYQRECGMTLDAIIEGVRNGSLTTTQPENISQ